MTTTVRLGDVTFTGFEIPEAIPFGGEQSVADHKLPGGVRVVDAMGGFDDDISWSGRFRGVTAALRARRIDTLRGQGRPLLLTWGAFRRQVLVTKFRAQYEVDGLEIPYSVTCLVVANLDAPVRRTPPSVDDLIDQDINAMMALGETLASMRQALARLQTAYAAYKAVKRGDMSALGAAIGNTAALGSAALGTATGPLGDLKSALVATSQAAITGIQLANAATSAKAIIATGDPAAAAAAVLGTTTALSQSGSLYQLQAFAGRAMTNLTGVRGRQTIADGAAQ